MLETILNPSDTKERCGLVLSDGGIVEIDNVSENPEDSYIMDPVAVLAFLPNTVGTWHTHPKSNNVLSGDDHRNFRLWPDLVHYILSPEGVRKYRVEDGAVI